MIAKRPFVQPRGKVLLRPETDVSSRTFSHASHILGTAFIQQTGAALDRHFVWEIISYAWTEIGIEDGECEDLVRKGNITPADLREVERIFFRDVCLSFAVESFLILPCFLWMIMPDWGWEESYLKRRIERWHARPYWVHLLNPVRWLGYPTALMFAFSYRLMIRRAVRKVHSNEHSK